VTTDGGTRIDVPTQGRTGRAAAIGAGLVVLATVGATGGWLLAGERVAPPSAGGPSTTVATRSPSPAGTSPAASPSAASRPPRTTDAAQPPPGTFPLPDLRGTNFEQARQELRRRKLGWSLVFGAAGEDRSVSGTRPPAGTPVRPGVTVTLLVVGAAPPATVSDLTGLPCDEAGHRAVDAGLRPAYPDGRTGTVLRQTPGPSAPARWNDRIDLSCGTSTSTGAPSPTS
jgi:hypothetical protein